MTITSEEQLAIELVNRTRLDPAGEAARLGIDDPDELAEMDVQDAPVSPLAANHNLSDAAADHSDWMLAADTFSHVGAGSSTAGERMSDAGYSFSGPSHWGENIGYRASTGTIDVAASVERLHLSFFRSDGHRTNMLNQAFREVGIGIEVGDYHGYDTAMETQDFATSNNRIFLTGVVYDDTDGNDFYSIGEGSGGTGFAIGNASTTSQSAGGYTLALSGNGAHVVTVSSGTATYKVRVETTGDNIKLDLVNGDTLLASTDLELLGGLAVDGGLLGAADLKLTGNGAANALTGNSGDNTIAGGQGNDTIDGGEGTDTAYLDVSVDEVTVTNTAAGVVITSAEGTDTFASIETFEFNDATLSFEDLFYYVNGEDPSSSLSANDPGTGSTASHTGTDGDDGIKGTDGNDLLSGLGGDDRLPGGAGDDTCMGGAGNDRLGGGSGNDSLIGGSGDDRGGGGDGNDTIKAGSGNDWFSGGSGDDDISGGDGNDRLAGSFGNDTVDGGAGADTMGGGAGHDVMHGGAGDDRIGAGHNNDTVHGGSGHDYVGGGEQNDRLFGDGGNDTLNGGHGDDTLTGGAGADTFVFNQSSGGGSDVITDFEAGVDTLRLVGLSNVDDFDKVKMTDTAAGVSIDYGHHTILLEDVSVADLGAGDFVFV